MPLHGKIRLCLLEAARIRLCNMGHGDFETNKVCAHTGNKRLDQQLLLTSHYWKCNVYVQECLASVAICHVSGAEVTPVMVWCSKQG